MKCILSVAAALAAAVTISLGAAAGDPAEAKAPAAQALPKLVDLGSTKCTMCKAMIPVLEALRKEFAGRLAIEFVDVRENPEAAKPYKIQLIPTQIFYAPDGKELFRHQGFISRDDILAKWKDLGHDLTAAK